MGNIFVSDKQVKGLKNFMKQHYNFDLIPKETAIIHEQPTFLDLRVLDKNSAKARYVRRIKKSQFNLSKDSFTRLQLDSFKNIDPIKHVFNLDTDNLWLLLGSADRPTLRDDLNRRERHHQPFTEETLNDISVAMAKGLAQLHQIGISHQCIEPRVWILDFNNATRLTHYRVTNHSTQVPKFNQKQENKAHCFDHYMTYSSSNVLKDFTQAAHPKEDSYNFGRVLLLMILIGRRDLTYEQILEQFQAFMSIPSRERHDGTIGKLISRVEMLQNFSKKIHLLLRNLLDYDRDNRIEPIAIRQFLQLYKRWDVTQTSNFLKEKVAASQKSKMKFAQGSNSTKATSVSFDMRSASMQYSQLQQIKSTTLTYSSNRLQTEASDHISVISDVSQPIPPELREISGKVKTLRVAEGVYQGQLNEKGRMHGIGTLKYQNGKFYQGQWKDGKRVGKGLLKSKKGTTYQGQWKDDKKWGMGTQTYPNQSVYKGTFKNNKREGKGKYVYANGDKYQGDWLDGLKHGSGRYISEDSKHQYNGDFVQNLPQGFGEEKFPDGNQYKGEYLAGKMHGHGIFKWRDGDEYNGQWVDGQKCGQGSMNRLNGYSYQGQWANDSPHGFGVSNFPSGSRYTGYFSRAQRSGLGFYYDATAESYYTGQWQSGLRHGFGKEYRFDGYYYFGNFHKDRQDGWGVQLEAFVKGKYRGFFVNGMRHGIGRFDGANGEVYVGQFDGGLRSGYGRLSTPDGYNYEGMFEGDERNGYGVQSWIAPSEKAGVEMYWGEFKVGMRHGEGTVELWKQNNQSGELQGCRYKGIQIYGSWQDDDKVEVKKIPDLNDWINQTLIQVKKWQRIYYPGPKTQNFQPYIESTSSSLGANSGDQAVQDLNQMSFTEDNRPKAEEQEQVVKKEQLKTFEKDSPVRKLTRKGTMSKLMAIKQKNYLHSSQPILVDGKRKMTLVKSGIGLKQQDEQEQIF